MIFHNSESIADLNNTNSSSDNTTGGNNTNTTSDTPAGENNTNTSESNNNFTGILNSDFEDGLNGWDVVGSVSLFTDGQNNSYISLNPGGVESSISQNINWTSIDKISFKYKHNNTISYGTLKVTIGNTVICNFMAISPSEEWNYIEYDTSSIEGFATLTFQKNMKSWPESYVGFIDYVLKSSNEDTNGTSSNSTETDSTSGNNTNGTSTNITDGNSTGNGTNSSSSNVTGGNSTGNDSDATPVTKLASSISAAKVSATYNVAKNLVITLKDSNGKALSGKAIIVKVGTISKTVKTNANGQASVNVATLVPKTYTATVSFAGDNEITQSSATAKVVVSKVKPKLTAKAKTFKVKTKTKKVTATLKDNKGKVLKNGKVTLKIKGKTYKAKTNKKGVATFKVTKLNKKGTFKGKVKFAGNKYFKAISKTVKVKVKK